jgi:hypothetical protein
MLRVFYLLLRRKNTTFFLFLESVLSTLDLASFLLTSFFLLCTFSPLLFSHYSGRQGHQPPQEVQQRRRPHLQGDHGHEPLRHGRQLRAVPDLVRYLNFFFSQRRGKKTELFVFSKTKKKQLLRHGRHPDLRAGQLRSRGRQPHRRGHHHHAAGSRDQPFGHPYPAQRVREEEKRGEPFFFQPRPCTDLSNNKKKNVPSLCQCQRPAPGSAGLPLPDRRLARWVRFLCWLSFFEEKGSEEGEKALSHSAAPFFLFSSTTFF